jgi:hypothetical protein
LTQNQADLEKEALSSSSIEQPDYIINALFCSSLFSLSAKAWVSPPLVHSRVHRHPASLPPQIHLSLEFQSYATSCSGIHLNAIKEKKPKTYQHKIRIDK